MKTKLLFSMVAFFLISELKAQSSAPVANAGFNQTVVSNYTAPVVLDGSLSYTPNAKNFTYRWTSIEGWSLSDIHAEKPTFTVPTVMENTIYHFQLVINNGTTDSAPDEVLVNMIPNVKGAKMKLYNINKTDYNIYATTINGYDENNSLDLAYQYHYIFSPKLNNSQAVYDNLRNNLKTEYSALLPAAAPNTESRMIFESSAMSQNVSQTILDSYDFSQNWDVLNNPQINMGNTVSVIENETIDGVSQSNGILSQSDIDLQKEQKFNVYQTDWYFIDEYVYINGILTLITNNYNSYAGINILYDSFDRYYETIATKTLSPKTSGVTLYPNPAKDYINIPGLEKPENLFITDISGKTVLQKTVQPYEKINISALPKGIYLVKVNDKTAKLMVGTLPP